MSRRRFKVYRHGFEPWLSVYLCLLGLEVTINIPVFVQVQRLHPDDCECSRCLPF